MIALCYNVVLKMRAHCSNIAKILAYAIFDGASFWVINAKKKSIFFLRGNKIALQKKGDTIENLPGRLVQHISLYKWIKKRKGNPFPEMNRPITTGKLGQLVGCTIKSLIEVPEGAVNKR